MPSRSKPNLDPPRELSPPHGPRPPDAAAALATTRAESDAPDRAARHRPTAASVAHVAAARSDDARWLEGPPTRPDFFQDNGFLQNPDDSTDRTPLPTRPCTLSDRVAYQAWSAASAAALLAPQLTEAAPAYQRFLFGRGAPGQVDYEAFLRDDPAGRVVAANLTREGQKVAEAHYRQLVATHPEAAGEIVRFRLSGPLHRVLSSSETLPGPESENWLKAIGDHAVWSSLEVEVSPALEAGEPPRFAMKLTIHAEDRYNFNRGQRDCHRGVADAENGRFEECGLGQQYTNHGVAERAVEWRGGHAPQDYARYRGGDRRG